MILAAVSTRNLNPASVLYEGDIAPLVNTERLISTRSVLAAGSGLWATLLGLGTVAGMMLDRYRALA